MKKTIIFILLFISTLCSAQVVELAKLSSGELVYSTRLWDRDADDLYGYFYIFEKDKIEKDVNRYEYVLLDKNLNKVSSGEFDEKRAYSGFLGGSMKQIFRVVYRNGFISLGTFLKSEQFSMPVSATYRLLDIKDNKLSDSFTLLPDLTKEYNPEPKKLGSLVAFTYYPNAFGYALDAPVLTTKEKGTYKIRIGNNYSEKVVGDAESRLNKTYFVNEKLEPLWSYSYPENAGKRQEYTSFSFAGADYGKSKGIIIGAKKYMGSKNEIKINKGQLPLIEYPVFNKNSGELISTIAPLSTKTKEVQIKDVSVNKIFAGEEKDKITFINLTMNSKKNILDENLIQGFSKVEYKISTGEELKRDYFTWTQLAGLLDINENGFVKEKGDPDCYLYLHNTLLKDNGNLIFIMEEYKPLAGGFAAAGAKINDMFFMELDKDMQLVQFKRIEKEKQTIRNGIKMSGSQVDEYGYFDYAGYQHLDGDNYLFFYYNKQKPEDGGKKQWVLGIVSYIDGKITEQKLPLKSEDGSNMSISPAKKGYIMIYESFKELRLEKINY